MGESVGLDGTKTNPRPSLQYSTNSDSIVIHYIAIQQQKDGVDEADQTSALPPLRPGCGEAGVYAEFYLM
jgi:hypothetical protein